MKSPRLYFDEISRVDFSLLSSDEVRKISVKQIVNPNAFDELGNPTLDGLCSPELGPIKKGEKCLTCGMGWLTCPGHFGHIELPSYFYNPITIKLVIRILEASCVYCYKLRLTPLQSKILGSKLLLLRTGYILEMNEIDDIVLRCTGGQKEHNDDESLPEHKGIENDGGSESGEEVYIKSKIGTDIMSGYVHEVIQKIDTYVKNVVGFSFPPKSNKIPRSYNVKNFHATHAMIGMEKNFLKSLPQTCPHCDMYNPNYYEFKNLKIFQKPIPPKYYKDIVLKCINLKDTLYGPPASDSDGSYTGINDDIKDNETFSTKSNTYIDSEKVFRRLQRVCENDGNVLSLMYGSYDFKKFTYNISANYLFLDVICVTPNNFRPFSKLYNKVFVHPQNVVLGDILKDIYNIQMLCSVDPGKVTTEDITPGNGKKRVKEMLDAIIKLQNDINVFYDSSKANFSKKTKTPPGVRQVLEKKEGLIRKHMMGKRVNYSARSVISPDPNIDCNEIGIPYIFATRLTYTEPVTYFNVERLRKAVINGPHKWPGASHVQIDNNALLSLEMFDEMGRRSIAGQLLTPAESGEATVQQKVHRHILTGDFVLFNRQPTLHKPSIMCHTARILPNEKTIRLNYVNCNTYNADFDGDEMNIHFPQDEVSRAEAMLIARTSKQYLGPANGDVLRGLVQDHVCAGVLMCSRGVFFNRKEYVQLVYDSLRPERDLDLEDGDHNIEHYAKNNKNGRIVLLAPSIIAPVQRWTGKQVISTVILNVLGGLLPFNMSSKVSLSAKQIEVHDSEDLYVNFLDGEMLTGYMDKSQLGAKTYGTMHSIYEIYGSYYSEKLLSSLGRLFTGYLQSVGFSCRLKDLRLDDNGNEKRRKEINESRLVGSDIMKDFLTAYGYGCSLDDYSGNMDYGTMKNIIQISEDENKNIELETRMKASSNRFTSKIISNCMPSNLLTSFPMNSMQVMTLSGAKGSAINSAQISVLLGQQELEGKRVPIMLSGKTLPSFFPYDISIRAGGFISDRFFTGVRPQEYYFHCMAGREGLIDTAVKTSRSGYLQRCLVKHLEDIKVEYDGTVRSGNGSVIQFSYGEDSLDVSKSKGLFRFDFCTLNYKSYLIRYDLPRLAKSNIDTSSVKSYIKKMKKRNLPTEPLLSRFSPSRYIGAVSDLFNDKLVDYIDKNPLGLLYRKGETPQRNSISAENFELLMKLKYQMSLVEPGEAVGILAAQSIGEPSTQMTLNTFHLAGFGAKNITLGVPRLQEVIMMALKSSKTPIMKLEIKDSSEETANRVCDLFSRLCLWDIMEDLVVEENIKSYEKPMDIYCRVYLIKFKLFNAQICSERYNLSKEDINNFLKYRFLSILSNHINREINSSIKRSAPSTFRSSHVNNSEVHNDANESVNTQDNVLMDGAPSGELKIDNEGTGENYASKASAFTRATAVNSKRRDDTREVSFDVEHSDSESSVASDAIEEAKNEIKTSIKKEHERASFFDQMDTENDDEDSNNDKKHSLPVNEAETCEEFKDEEHFNYPRYISSYKFPINDKQDSLCCCIEVEFSIETKILIISSVEALCKKAIIRQVKGVTKCVVTPKDSEMQKSVSITADGVNLSRVWELKDFIDCNTIYTNEISAVLLTYGVEAARAAIVSEIKNVFSAYGINVSFRHLSLIADYITFEGEQRPLNRIGFNYSPSPFSKMSFETTFTFLKNAALLADFEDFKTPSSCLMVGKHTPVGTGTFDIVYPL